MSWIHVAWPYIDSFLRITPGIILLPLTLFLGWKKIGHKVQISYSTLHERLTATRLSDIVITNLKDKPLTVHEIYAVVDRHIILSVHKPHPPLVIKGLESLAVNTDPVSNYYLNEEQYELNPYSAKLFEIYISTHNGIIKCKTANPPSLEYHKKFEGYAVATRNTQNFNGIIYNENAAYAIIYKYEGVTKTAIVDIGGLILTNWPFLPNALSSHDIKSEQSVKAALMSSEIQYLIKESELHVHKL